MTETLRGGVVGAGVFGGFHTKKYASLPGVTLAGVYDVHPERAEALAEPLGGKGFSDFHAFLEAVDVVTVASPAVHHAGQALAALRAGKHVYVEKPLAIDLADADAIQAEAAKRKLVVACGHQQRVIFQAMGLFDIPEQPLLLESLRHGLASPRSLDVSVVLDLMIHDLDLTLSISTAEPFAVEAEGSKGEGRSWDAARAEVTFEGGFTAIFDVSRVAPTLQRTMKIVYPSGEVEIDFVSHEFRNTTRYPLNPDFAETPAARDSLGASVASFLAAVRGEAPRPVVTAGEAARALDLALAVEHALEDDARGRLGFEPYAAGAAAMSNAHDYAFTSIDGADLPLSVFKDKVVLVVNTASACGLTPQYEGLEKLYADYRDQGLIVLGVPCNQFAGQEPGTEDEIKAFCETRFNIDFPLTSKAEVKGEGAHPFYKWAKEELGEPAVPTWNFHKILIGKNGEAVQAFGPRTEPLAEEVVRAVEAELR